MNHNYQAKEGGGFVLLPAGDYVLKVESIEEGYCQSGKSAGAARINIDLSCPQYPGAKVRAMLIDTESMAWKTDMFITAFNLQAAVGADVELSAATMCGLQGWCSVSVKESEKLNPNTGKPYQNNEVSAFLTKREKLPRIIPAPELDPMDEPRAPRTGAGLGDETAGGLFD